MWMRIYKAEACARRRAERSMRLLGLVARPVCVCSSARWYREREPAMHRLKIRKEEMEEVGGGR